MCGIAGIWLGQAVIEGGDLASRARSMLGPIAHRGPDSRGEWIDASQGIALAHLRLAIIDVSAEGRQPMHSHDERFVLSYNGEIYNYQDLRAALERECGAVAWRGHSDTEVLLAGFSHWGVTETLRRCNGMFALAAWDRRLSELYLARDRIGEKPLYYAAHSAGVMFGSDLGALRASVGDHDIDPVALAALLRLGYVPDPMTILRGVHKLPPATVLVARRGTDRGLSIEMTRYWDLAAIAQAGIDRPIAADAAEIIELLGQKLERAVRLRMVSDVPLGAFLSGGIDSSLVVAAMKRAARGQIRTFSIGFNDPAFDESQHAAAVAHHLGTEHREFHLAESDALEFVPQLARMYGEPFADSSQLPTALVARMARREVTVALTGDGGDELFWGYPRYLLGKKLARVPRPIARASAGLLAALPDVAGLDRVKKLVPMLGARDDCDRYVELMSAFAPSRSGREGGDSLAARWWDLPRADIVERMVYVDQSTYLPHDMLVKVDRATMWSSLEARVPLLDPELIEFSWTVPRGLKLRDGKGKWILRELLYRYVPRELVDRPKAGFAVPLAAWLRGPLRDWLCDVLSPAEVAAHGLVDPALVARLLADHLSGRRSWHAQLWTLAILHQWVVEWKRPSIAAY